MREGFAGRERERAREREIEKGDKCGTVDG
jgi:hypothetical protein